MASYFFIETWGIWIQIIVIVFFVLQKSFVNLTIFVNCPQFYNQFTPILLDFSHFSDHGHIFNIMIPSPKFSGFLYFSPYWIISSNTFFFPDKVFLKLLYFLWDGISIKNFL